MLSNEAIEKLNLLQSLAKRCSPNCGEQFIIVYVSVNNMNSGEIRYGFDWKKEMGEITFSNLDEAIEIVKKLLVRAK